MGNFLEGFYTGIPQYESIEDPGDDGNSEKRVRSIEIDLMEFGAYVDVVFTLAMANNVQVWRHCQIASGVTSRWM